MNAHLFPLPQKVHCRQKKTKNFLCLLHSFQQKNLQLRLHKGSDFPFLCVAVFLCVCVWLFGLAGGEKAAGVVLSGPDLLFTLFSSRSKEGADLPNTKSEIIVQHLQSDSLNFFFFFFLHKVVKICHAAHLAFFPGGK